MAYFLGDVGPKTGLTGEATFKGGWSIRVLPTTKSDRIRDKFGKFRYTKENEVMIILHSQKGEFVPEYNNDLWVRVPEGWILSSAIKSLKATPDPETGKLPKWLAQVAKFIETSGLGRNIAVPSEVKVGITAPPETKLTIDWIESLKKNWWIFAIGGVAILGIVGIFAFRKRK